MNMDADFDQKKPQHFNKNDNIPEPIQRA